MTETQLQLLDASAAEPKLTGRQAFAFRVVVDAGADGVHADEVGAAWCAKRGKHPVGSRCEWCGSNGNQVLAALRRKGLVRYRRRRRNGSGGVWVAVGACDARPVSGMLSAEEPIPF